jgi:hypothetical protein
MNLLKEQLRELRELQQGTSASLANLHLYQQELRRSIIKTEVSWLRKSQSGTIRQTQ